LNMASPSSPTASAQNCSDPNSVPSDRREPELEISNIIGENGANRSNYLTLAQLIGSNTALSAANLQNAIRNRRDADGNPINPALFKNDHLVVRIPSNEARNWAAANQTFNEKVIFIVENGGNFNANGNMYNSHESSSTMVYVEPGGTLAQFGGQGLFKGLVYIADSDLTPVRNHTFSWGPNSVIDGGVQVRSGVLTWNAGGAPRVRRNQDILNNFGFMIDCETNCVSNGDYVKQDQNRGVELTPIGFYFR